MDRNRHKSWVSTFVISTFVVLYLIVSVISTIHVIDFFQLSNPDWLAISLAIGFEVGAAASLASLIVLDKVNKGVVWILFLVLTAMQAMGNTYYAYAHLKDFTKWSELFGLVEEDLIYQKRVISVISGAILPFVALGFIKSLVDYIRPQEDVEKKESLPEPPKEVQSELLDLGSSSDYEVQVAPPKEKQEPPVVIERTETPIEKTDPEISHQIEEIKSTEQSLPVSNVEETIKPLKEEQLVGARPIEEDPNRNSIWYRIFNNNTPPVKNN